MKTGEDNLENISMDRINDSSSLNTSRNIIEKNNTINKNGSYILI
jgi:hypothetical protein